MLFYLLLSLIYINGGDINHINPISNSISNLKNQLLEHNFLKCLSNDDFKNMQEAASIFAKNHFTHSSNFINHLQTVTNKINDKTFNSQLVSETQQELGNYKHKYIDKLTQIGVDPEWYNKIPHKYLSQRFFEATQFKIQTQKQIENTQIKHVENINIAGNEFIYNKYMTNLYNSDKYNECELFAVIGHSKICENIYNVSKYDTQLTDDKIVIFPLHILMEKQNDLIKQSFQKCMVKNTLKCKIIKPKDRLCPDAITNNIPIQPSITLPP
eukprot:227099_1